MVHVVPLVFLFLLIGLSVILISVVRDLIAVENWLDRPTAKENNSEVCLTPGCVLAASDVLKKINRSADPCDNFYEFACGNFLKETIIPSDKLLVGTLTNVEVNEIEKLRVIMSEPSTDDEARPFRLAKDFYQTCLNEKQIKNQSVDYIKDSLKRLGGWPVVEGDKWDESRFTWETTTYKLVDEGFPCEGFFTLSVTSDPKTNSTKRVICIEPPLGFNDGSLEEIKKLRAECDAIVEVAVRFGADRSRAVKELKESLDFKIKIANISSPITKRYLFSRLNNPMSISQLTQKFPSIPWAEYISTILPKSVNVKPDDIVIVPEPAYFEGLEKLLSTTPKRVQANYMMWLVLTDTMSLLKTNELRPNNPQWKLCIGHTIESFDLAVSSLYVHRYFKIKDKKPAQKIANNIREEMVNTLHKVRWMDNKARSNAIAKVKSMTFIIAYKDEILNVSKLEDFYKKCEITQGNFIKSALKIHKFHLDFHLGRLRDPVDKNDWTIKGSGAFGIPFYFAIGNYFYSSASFLKEVAFSSDRPNYMNYGAFGWAIGHEMNHGLDNIFRQLDKDGKPDVLWSPSVQNAFDKKDMCLVRQYGNYTVKQVNEKVNGLYTVCENMADNGGIKQAYQAYSRWVTQHGTEKRLPGLQDFTPQQMFWISAANMYCTKYSSDYLKIMISSNYPPDEFRIIGTFSNSYEFANDFKCSSGSNMNPIEKCEYW